MNLYITPIARLTVIPDNSMVTGNLRRRRYGQRKAVPAHYHAEGYFLGSKVDEASGVDWVTSTATR